MLKYLDSVIITSGFYEGYKGLVVDEERVGVSVNYLVDIYKDMNDNYVKRKTVRIGAENIQKIVENK